jgi:hypothetical protein
MMYDVYRGKGWPIGSGNTEAGVKTFNKRVKGTESRRGACRFNRHGICYILGYPQRPGTVPHKPPPPGVIHICGIIEYSSVFI